MRKLNRYIAVSVIVLASFPVIASDLSSAAHDFIDAHDRLVKTRTEVADDRSQMAADLDDTNHLQKSVQEWFGDRSDISRFSLEKAAARGDMLNAANFTPPLVQKPQKATGNLQQDAKSFITHFDIWDSLNTVIEADTEKIRNALDSGDAPGLQSAVQLFFTDRRTRETNRLQWKSDLSSLVKILKFKGTAKSAKPPGNSLREHTQEFLLDHDEWQTILVQIQGDLNNLRATVNSDSLEASVRTMLVDRNREAAKEKEMSLDRKAMRARNALKSIGSTLKELVIKNSPKEGDVDEEEYQLEQTENHLGVTGV